MDRADGHSPLGIVAALDAEARAVGARTAPPGEAIALGDGAILVRCGIGRGRAGRAAERLLEAGARALLSWGTAAALSPERSAGDIVLPEDVLARDGRRYVVDDAWRQRIAALAGPPMVLHGGTVAETEEVLRDADAKELLRTLSGADIADMESGAIAEVCAAAGAPLLVVRAVSDSARTRIPNCALAAVNADGDLRPWRCLGRLLLTPGDLPALLRLAAGFGAARGSLTRLAATAGEGFRTGPTSAHA